MIQSIRPSLDCMAVGASHYAFRDFTLSLRDAFRVAHVQSLVSGDVVEVEGRRMGIETTINASSLNFVGINPSSDRRSPLVRLLIDALPIIRISKALLAPLLCFDWIVWAITRAAVGLSDLLQITRTPSLSSLYSMQAFFFFGEHRMIVSLGYPCKPDIFEATYDPAE